MRLVERVGGYYAEEELPFGTCYRWQPCRITVECHCGKRQQYTRSELIERVRRRAHQKASDAVDHGSGGRGSGCHVPPLALPQEAGGRRDATGLRWVEGSVLSSKGDSRKEEP